jgi:hypothetical protein
LRARDRKHGPHPLATAGDEVTGKRRNQRDFALHPLEDHGVDGVHTRGGQRQHRLQRGFMPSGAQRHYLGSHRGGASRFAAPLASGKDTIGTRGYRNFGDGNAATALLAERLP